MRFRRDPMSTFACELNKVLASSQEELVSLRSER